MNKDYYYYIHRKGKGLHTNSREQREYTCTHRRKER